MNKKTRKTELNEVLTNMPANGVSYTPDGRGDIIPQPVVTANNLLKAQVPTPAAAMAGAFPAQGIPAPMAPQQSAPEEETEEEEEEDEDEVTEVEEAARIQFRSALVELLGENISESLVSKLEGIFEAAVQDRVNAHLTESLTNVDLNVKNYLNEVTETLVDKVDDYLDYVVEEWMQENSLAVEQGIKTQIAENFIHGLKNLFENHYIDVPNDKYHALDELYSNNMNLEQQLNQAINENINLRKEVNLTECAGIFVSETRDLADTQVARLQSLMENVAFGTPDEYRNKLVAIKNNYLQSQNFVRPVPQPTLISEEMTFSPVKQLAESTNVDQYADVISKLNKKL